MLGFNQGFIGYKPNSQINFSGGDTEELYNLNLKSQSTDWYYRYNPIIYSHNNYGHRSKSIEHIDLNNYILCVGCSHTEGIGNYEQDTYPYQVSQQLNCDYYNMGLGGCGVDIMIHNLITWMACIKQLPKLLVWQWPDPVRYVTIEESTPPLVVTHGLWEHKREVTDFILTGDGNNFFSSRVKLAEEYLNVLSKITPVIQVSLQEQESLNTIFYQSHDYARDGKHNGSLSNKTLTMHITDKYNYELNNN
jgi:hypothetical protein